MLFLEKVNVINKANKNLNVYGMAYGGWCTIFRCEWRRRKNRKMLTKKRRVAFSHCTRYIGPLLFPFFFLSQVQSDEECLKCASIIKIQSVFGIRSRHLKNRELEKRTKPFRSYGAPDAKNKKKEIFLVRYLLNGWIGKRNIKTFHSVNDLLIFFLIKLVPSQYRQRFHLNAFIVIIWILYCNNECAYTIHICQGWSSHRSTLWKLRYWVFYVPVLVSVSKLPINWLLFNEIINNVPTKMADRSLKPMPPHYILKFCYRAVCEWYHFI